MYTKTQEQVKIIECGFFCLKGVYWESKLPKPDPNAQKLSKLESNEIFNDFAISREPFDEIFYFKDTYELENITRRDWTRSHKNFRSWSRM